MFMILVLTDNYACGAEKALRWRTPVTSLLIHLYY